MKSIIFTILVCVVVRIDKIVAILLKGLIVQHYFVYIGDRK